ncbi:magnesium-transporting ATPase [Enterococcus pseudoavium]|nr:magnesium-transporting ATPase [Enterococcus pseudoavium]
MKKTEEVQTVEENFDDVEIPVGLEGLTVSEVQRKIEDGQINQVEENLLKSDKEIIKENTINIFNILNFVLALLVLLVGSPKNTLFFGVVIINTLIGVIQELRAKHTIDKLSVLAKTKAVVLRDGRLQQIDQEHIVLGETLYLRSGDQVPVDGKLLAGAGVEVDESLLTGEADRVQKTLQDQLYSGSFITAGECFYQGTAVGKDNFAEQLTSEAKTKKTGNSELTKVLSRMIAVLTVVIIPVGLGLFYSQYQASESIKQAVLGTVAALVSMIPEGLMLLTSVAFAVGAANLARKKVLVQALPSIETLARVDVICLDKTGTITDGTLKFEEELLEEGVSEERLDQIMGALLVQLNDQNATAKALREAFPPVVEWADEKVVPFSSARKWSGVTFKEQGSFAFGAPEFIFKNLPQKIQEKIQPYLAAGQRVLVLVEYPTVLEEELAYEPQLLATLIISDNLRENARATFGYFAQQDVQLKVISGDHPLTVSKIAQKAGIKDAEIFIDMSSISEPIDYKALVDQTTVFGRVTPKQKQALIRALKETHTVCMTGDGVNDVLALREADIGVAMANGSSAARAAADVILLDSDFARMQNVLNEGRRVINNIERVASMYLVKTIYSLILAVIFMFIANPYPFEPVQLTPINALTVGIPSFFLALKPSYERIKGDFLNNILRVSLPGALTVVSAVMVIQLAAVLFQLDYQATSTMSVFLTGCVGLLVLYKVSFPLDKKKIALIAVLAGAYLSCYLFFREFFDFDKLWNRNLFFVIPLTFGIYWLFKGLTLIMDKLVGWRIAWQAKHRVKHK